MTGTAFLGFKLFTSFFYKIISKFYLSFLRRQESISKVIYNPLKGKGESSWQTSLTFVF